MGHGAIKRETISQNSNGSGVLASTATREILLKRERDTKHANVKIV